MSGKRITVKREDLKVVEESIAEKLFPRLEAETSSKEDLVSRLRREAFMGQEDKSVFSRDEELVTGLNEGLKTQEGFDNPDSFALFVGDKWTADPRLLAYDRYVHIKSPFEVSKGEFHLQTVRTNVGFVSSDACEVQEQFTKLESVASSAGRQMGARLRRVLFAKSQSRTQYDQEAGSLNRRALSQMLASPSVFNRLHQRKVEGEKLDTHVELLIDLSGSMSSRVCDGLQRVELASASALAMGDALDPLKSLGVSFGISGFTTGQAIPARELGSLSKDSYAVASMEELGKDYDRLQEPLEHSTWHKHGEDWRRTKLRLGLIGNKYAMRNNADGEALMWMQRHFSTMKVKRKILVVLSDGAPACNSNNYSSLVGKTRLEVLNLERQDVEVFGIGLGDNSVASIYSSFCVLNNERELETVLIDKLTEWLLKGQR
jgi:cobalamin biosynthesis protein CobT